MRQNINIQVGQIRRSKWAKPQYRTHVGLNSNLTAIEKELAEAEKNARDEAKKKQKTAGNGGKKVEASITPAEVEKAAASQTLSLFDPPTEDTSIKGAA